ncbi:hypothetical protein NSZ01_18850 [Nocardioides szechwanensis]|uniref:PASTA domain-containing protein n=2 Tax=Nocardioides szechwanensis TaxID=1005944 RepID=A0A1H0GZ10_9ACTN|nr:hypothetical protein NSZ01_18850 [Nocardioides szechwanensis]SDO12113.1 Protein of unknown function [Nocardioides szechwanensis]
MACPPAPWPVQPANWYPDPADGRLIRYWDGRAWTAHTSPKPYGWYVGSKPAPRAWWQRGGGAIPGAMAVALAVVVLLAVGLLTDTTSSTSQDDDPPPAAASTESAPTPTPAPSSTPEPVAVATEPPRSVVPEVTGLSRSEAEAQLTAARLVVLEVRQVPSAQPRGTILGQNRKAGASIPAGAGVILTVAMPYPRVPDVVGRSESAAVSGLREAGFQVSVITETRTSGKDGVVLSQTPAGRDRAKPHSTITIVVSSVIRTVTPPPPPSNCTSGYSPCLTPAYDYDCAGGSGDGPEFAYGPVYVTGSDPYDLDRDGDGVACES